jgi:tight adherence protein B
VLGGLALVSAGLVAAACWLLVLDDRQRVAGGRALSRSATELRHRRLVAVALIAGVAPSGVLTDPVWMVNGAVGAVVAGAVVSLTARARARTVVAIRRARVLAVCDALVAELRSGQPAQRALEQVGRDWPELAPVVNAARLGGDVPAALRSLARVPGSESLREVAAAWHVSTRSGAGLADVLERMGTALREQEDSARETAAAVAPARATAQLLAVLPLVGLGLGSALGGDPLHVLFGSVVGSALLVIGVSLALVGVVWVERLVITAAS